MARENSTISRLLAEVSRVISSLSAPPLSEAYRRDRLPLLTSHSTASMRTQQDWNQLIKLLDQTADEVRQIADPSVSMEQALSTFWASFHDLFGSLKQIEKQQDEKHKLEVYASIASFVKESLLTSEEAQHVSLESCLKAVLIAYNQHSDRPSSPEVHRLLSQLRQTIISIRVHYYYANDGNICKRVTDIFFVRSHSDQPVHNQTEEVINWDTLPVQIRQAFVSEGKQKMSFQICP